MSIARVPQLYYGFSVPIEVVFFGEGGETEPDFANTLDIVFNVP